MAELYVDVDALGELSRQLQQVKQSLEGAKDDLGAYDRRLGSERIRDELEDFVDGWKDGRKKLIEGIDGLLGRVKGATEAYSKQEQELAKAAGGNRADPAKERAR